MPTANNKILQNLDRLQKIVTEAGVPTDYFIRFIQDRGGALTDLDALLTALRNDLDALGVRVDFLDDVQIVAGDYLSGGGVLGTDPVITLDHNTSGVTPGTYGDSTHVPQIDVDEFGHITDVTEVAISGGGGGGRTPFSLGTMPALSGFTQVNISGNFSITETSGKAFTFFDASPATGSKVAMVSRAVPVSTPYRVAICIATNSPGMQYLVPTFGFRKTGGPNFHVMGAIPSRYYSSTAFEIMTWSAPTTRVSTGGFKNAMSAQNFANGFVWVGMRDDGTNVHWDMSSDGVNWFELYSISKASGYLGSSGYNEVCAGMYSESDGSHTGTSYAWNMSLLDWDDNGLSRSYG